MFDPERAEQIQQPLENMTEEQLDQLLSRMVQKLVDEGYINTDQPQTNGAAGRDGQRRSQGRR